MNRQEGKAKFSSNSTNESGPQSIKKVVEKVCQKNVVESQNKDNEFS